MRILKWFFLVILLVALGGPMANAQSIVTAASCNQSAVNAVINGPTHTAVNGDTIIIPAGSCTWTSGITMPHNIGITIQGTGTPNSTPATSVPSSSCTQTVIIDDTQSGGTGVPLFRFYPEYGNSLSRLSCMQIQPQTGMTGNNPVEARGTCLVGGCPNFRVDNLTFPNSWQSVSLQDAAVINAIGVVGVVDHNSLSSTSAGYLCLVNVGHGSWLGVGQYGDNSWASADTLGTSQELYIENNTLDFAIVADTDVSNEVGGGGRYVARFNTFNDVPSGFAAVSNHGTETTGRARGGRSIESYRNTVNCSGNNGCKGVAPRSGVVLTFQNTYTATSSSWVSTYLTMSTQRAYRATTWGLCNGTGPYDVNDGASIEYTGTISSLGAGTLTVNGSPWTADAYHFLTNPTGKYYVVYDTTSGQLAGIQSNTSSTLTLSWLLSKIASPDTVFAVGDTIKILGSTLYASGTHTGATGSASLTDSTKSWTTNKWVMNGYPYSVLNVSTGQGYEIGESTGTTLSYFTQPYPNWTWTLGDQYAVVRASRCLDKVSSFGGSLLSGNPATLPTSPEIIKPSYEFDDIAGDRGTPTYAACNTQTQQLLANRDFYCETAGQAAQTSSVSPFDGTSGVGHGTLANRPTTCTSGVGYWAKDQGNWNQSGTGEQGQLYVCTATDAWSLYYTPYTYPHPLIAGGGTTGSSVNPPTGLSATVQ